MRYRSEIWQAYTLTSNLHSKKFVINSDTCERRGEFFTQFCSQNLLNFGYEKIFLFRGGIRYRIEIWQVYTVSLSLY